MTSEEKLWDSLKAEIEKETFELDSSLGSEIDELYENVRTNSKSSTLHDIQDLKANSKSPSLNDKEELERKKRELWREEEEDARRLAENPSRRKTLTASLTRAPSSVTRSQIIL
ncbi:hypothetical protein G5714_003126 [Onychostoma macrolepis]|uniref:Uncharacterized protein n=1 Tax=Onychostoma macrolepis TaxID=369639 RepID=A0A7J6D8L9_9TELE|nr:hypothetical protein G5714_003126 [Onychostoma macrolepis]